MRTKKIFKPYSLLTFSSKHIHKIQLFDKITSNKEEGFMHY